MSTEDIGGGVLHVNSVKHGRSHTLRPLTEEEKEESRKAIDEALGMEAREHEDAWLAAHKEHWLENMNCTCANCQTYYELTGGMKARWAKLALVVAIVVALITGIVWTFS